MFDCIKCENNVFENLINDEWVSSKENNYIKINFYMLFCFIVILIMLY